jgi:hypothetical protein
MTSVVDGGKTMETEADIMTNPASALIITTNLLSLIVFTPSRPLQLINTQQSPRILSDGTPTVYSYTHNH